MPSPETLQEFAKFLAAEKGVKQLTTADKNVVTVMREGENGRAFAAIDPSRENGKVTLPIGGVNAFDGKAYDKGEEVVLPPYGKLLVVEK